MMKMNSLPPGWDAAYGEEFREALKGRNFEFFVKFGVFCWSGDDAIRPIMEKYGEAFAASCCECGKRAVWRMRGTLMPYCNPCRNKLHREGAQFIKINQEGK